MRQFRHDSRFLDATRSDVLREFALLPSNTAVDKQVITRILTRRKAKHKARSKTRKAVDVVKVGARRVYCTLLVDYEYNWKGKELCVYNPTIFACVSNGLEIDSAAAHELISMVYPAGSWTAIPWRATGSKEEDREYAVSIINRIRSGERPGRNFDHILKSVPNHVRNEIKPNLHPNVRLLLEVQAPTRQAYSNNQVEWNNRRDKKVHDKLAEINPAYAKTLADDNRAEESRLWGDYLNRCFDEKNRKDAASAAGKATTSPLETKSDCHSEEQLPRPVFKIDGSSVRGEGRTPRRRTRYDEAAPEEINSDPINPVPENPSGLIVVRLLGLTIAVLTGAYFWFTKAKPVPHVETTPQEDDARTDYLAEILISEVDTVRDLKLKAAEKLLVEKTNVDAIELYDLLQTASYWADHRLVIGVLVTMLARSFAAIFQKLIFSAIASFFTGVLDCISALWNFIGNGIENMPNRLKTSFNKAYVWIKRLFGK